MQNVEAVSILCLYLFQNLPQRLNDQMLIHQSMNSFQSCSWTGFIHGLGWVKDDGSPHPIRVY